MLIRLIGAVLADLDRLAHMVRDLSLPRGLVALQFVKVNKFMAFSTKRNAVIHIEFLFFAVPDWNNVVRFKILT